MDDFDAMFDGASSESDSGSDSDSPPPSPKIHMSPPAVRHRFDSKDTVDDDHDHHQHFSQPTPTSSPSGPQPIFSNAKVPTKNDFIVMKESFGGDDSDSDFEDIAQAGSNSNSNSINKNVTGNMMDEDDDDFSDDEFDYLPTGNAGNKTGIFNNSRKAESKLSSQAVNNVGYFAVKEDHDAKNQARRQSQIDTFGFRGATSAAIDDVTNQRFENLARPMMESMSNLAAPKNSKNNNHSNNDDAKGTQSNDDNNNNNNNNNKPQSKMLPDDDDESESFSESFGERSAPLRTNKSAPLNIDTGKRKTEALRNSRAADLSHIQSPNDERIREFQRLNPPPSPTSPLVLDGSRKNLQGEDVNDDAGPKKMTERRLSQQDAINKQQASLYGNNNDKNEETKSNKSDKLQFDENDGDSENWRDQYPRAFYDKPGLEKPTQQPKATKAPPSSPANNRGGTYSDDDEASYRKTKSREILPHGRVPTRADFFVPQPKGLSMKKCYVVRTSTGMMSGYLYSLFLEPPGNGKPGGGMEGDGKFLMSAKKKGGTKTSYYQICSELEGSEATSLGKLRSNWSGGHYTIYDSGKNPMKTSDEDQHRLELGVIGFEYDKMGPGRMKVYAPKVEDGKIAKWRPNDPIDSIHSVLQQNNGIFDAEMKKRITMCENKRPKWDPQQKGHVLNFKGRVTESSVKNFQLTNYECGDTTILQFGRVKKNTFTLDFGYPLCALQAFAISLSSLDGKLADSKGFELLRR